MCFFFCGFFDFNSLTHHRFALQHIFFLLFLFLEVDTSTKDRRRCTGFTFTEKSNHTNNLG